MNDITNLGIQRTVTDMIFPYGENELEYLKERDAILGKVIDRVGMIERETDDDIFAQLVRSVMGQQISNKALITVEGRLMGAVGELTPRNIIQLGTDRIRSCGMSARKAENIFRIAENAESGKLELAQLRTLSDGEIIKRLTALSGIGEWTAEMMLIFCFERMNVLSFGDFGIRRGIELLYGEEKLTRAKIREYHGRYSPYATVASFYLWKVGNGEIDIPSL